MKLQLLFVLLFFSLMGCTWENQDSTGSLKVNFVHTFQDSSLQILESNQLIYTTTTGNKFNIKNLKYYIAKLTLYQNNGAKYDVNMVKLINPMEQNTNYQNYTLSNIPNGKYSKISFVFGVDSARNTFPFGLPNNSENNSMEWPFTLGGGYHFMMMEGVFQNSKNDTVGYAIHLGVTPNQFYNEFPLDLTVNGNDQSIDLQVNMEQWFNGINKINLNDGYGYMMEDQQKQLLFKQNGVSVFTLK